MKDEYDVFNAGIGRRLKSLRLKRNYTREGLAKQAGISSKFLYEIEMGRKGCSAFVLYNLASSLDVNINCFILEEKDLSSTDFQALYMQFGEKEKREIHEIMKILHGMLHKN